MKKTSITKLRSDIYKLIDSVIETGNPIVVERNGEGVKIIPIKKKSKLDNLVGHPGTIVGDPEDIVHMDWYDEWSEKE